MVLALTVAREDQGLARVGAMTCEVTAAPAQDPALDGPLEAAARAVQSGAGLDTGPARSLYRAIGLDPTRTRPSSEALLRRVLRGEALGRINTLVDLCNWCSLEVQLPYGLYDLDRVRPPVEVRRGRPGEEYAGIRKDVVHLAGRLVVADADGPFGNPTSDSARTMVTIEARRILVVVFGPATMAMAAMGRVLDMTTARLAEFARGRETWRWVS